MKTDMTQVVAMAVINRLHNWCVQLFWITVLCVMGCCGDEKSRTSIWQLHEQEQRRQQHLSPSQKRTTSIADIEMKVRPVLRIDFIDRKPLRNRSIFRAFLLAWLRVCLFVWVARTGHLKTGRVGSDRFTLQNRAAYR